MARLTDVISCRRKPAIMWVFWIMVTFAVAAMFSFRPAPVPHIRTYKDIIMRDHARESRNITHRIEKMKMKNMQQMKIKNNSSSAAEKKIQIQEEEEEEDWSFSEKWIVITTIAQPTEDIKFVASLEGWKVVVVGDVKTPANWSYPNCDFLSIQKQKELNFYSTDLVPEKSYTRKIIGYLYAIQHGAKVIYETDDDNRPTDRLKRFDYGITFSALEFAGSRLFNPYHHFGQSSLWPRGFPLSGIGLKSSRQYRMTENMPTALIQQGLVNGDPDMDAIFRLTRKKAETELDVHFDPAAPTVSLPPGVFCPFNSQNTLFHYGAFWGLLLPTTTTMRVCDIWRGYWAQRLLWEINGQLAFYPPNAYQKRNSHSYLEDALDEDQMYKNTERLIEFLTKWTCDAELSFFGCVETLTSDMVAAGFVGQRDADLSRAWLADLSSMGYIEPSRVSLGDLSKPSKPFGRSRTYANETMKLCRQRPLDPKLIPEYNETNVIFYPVEQKAPVLHPRNQSSLPKLFQHLSLANDACPNSNLFSNATNLSNAFKATNFFDDMLLIFSFNLPDFYLNIRYLEAAYRPLFPNIVYCGPDHVKFQQAVNKMPKFQHLSFIEVDTSCGYLAYSCTLQAMRLGYNVTGYFQVADDMLINPWNFIGMNKSQVWATKTSMGTLYPKRRPKWSWWFLPVGKHAFELTVKDVLQTSDPSGAEGDDRLVKFLKAATTRDGKIMRGFSDIYYIPARLERLAKKHLTTFYSRSFFLEIAIPTLLYGLEPESDIQGISGANLEWSERQKKNIWDFFGPKTQTIHPIKLTVPRELNNFCERFMVELMKNMYWIPKT